jgi:type II secretory pathway component GspD/PulD (secretin)
MKMIKGISSHLIFKKYPSNRFVYRKLWSRGYRAFEIKDVENVNQVASYIINQKTDNIDKRFFPNWKPRRLVAGFLMITMMLFLVSCSPSPKPENALSISTPTEEAEADTQAPSREIISSYENLKGNSKEPKPECRVVCLKNVSADKVVDTVSRAIPNVIAVKNDESNSIVIRGIPDDLAEAQKIISSLDKKIPQILIEGKVIEVSQSGLSDIGVEWSMGQGTFKYTVSKKTGNMDQMTDILASVNALVGSGKAKILADPKIMALDGKEAEINIGSRIPYAVPASSSSIGTQWTVQYIDAGVNLKILSSVANDGSIVSTIRPEVSNISEWRTTSAGAFPVISTRNASVTVRLKDGETLVIGGLLNESESENVTGVPGVSEIPVVGGLFKRSVTEKTKTDIIFLITPHLMK